MSRLASHAGSSTATGAAVYAHRAPCRRPRLAYVVNSLDPGGTERLVVQMSRSFAAEFSVDVICLDTPGAWASDLRAEGIPVHCLWREPGLDLSIVVKLANHFRREGIEIVHAHQCTPWQYSALSRLLHRAPRLLFQEHGRFHPEVVKSGRRWVNRHVVRRLTDRFVAVSDDIRMRLERYEGLDRHQVELVYNGVAPTLQLSPEERSALRCELGFESADFVVGSVGRLDPIKNPALLVDSLAQAAARCGDIRGLLVGDGPLQASTRDRVRRLGLDARIVFTGFRQDVQRLLQCMDLFVLPSLSEGTSLALLEAMAAGVPVVVTAVGGNPEIVEHGVTGWVVPSGDVAALTLAIVDVASNPQRSETLSKAAHRRFTARFSFDSMIRQYRQIYSELLTANPGTASLTSGRE